PIHVACLMVLLMSPNEMLGAPMLKPPMGKFISDLNSNPLTVTVTKLTTPLSVPTVDTATRGSGHSGAASGPELVLSQMAISTGSVASSPMPATSSGPSQAILP